MSIGGAWALIRKMDRLLRLEEEHGKATIELEGQMLALDRRLSYFESRQEVMVNEAKAAARSASYEATQGVAFDLARRVGALEARAKLGVRERITPSEAD